jgi:hypothetical protein
MIAPGTRSLEIREDGIADLADEGIAADLPLLWPRRSDDVLLPVADILKTQTPHFARSKPVHGEEQEHGAVAQSTRCVAAMRVEQLLHLAPGGTLRQSLMRVQMRRINLLRDARATPAARGGVAKETA